MKIQGEARYKEGRSDGGDGADQVNNEHWDTWMEEFKSLCVTWKEHDLKSKLLEYVIPTPPPPSPKKRIKLSICSIIPFVFHADYNRVSVLSTG